MVDRNADPRSTALGRRDFLKLIGLSGAALASGGCAPEVPDLVPYVWPPENIQPGKAVYFATTCRECPAGCGLLAKNMDGRVIKLEGNPASPINRGRLCPRGQAALTGLYNPDRLRRPLSRNPDGTLRPLRWPEAYAVFNSHLERLKAEGRSERIVFLTGLVTGTLRDLIAEGLSRVGAGHHAHFMYEGLAYESLRAANQAVFGRNALPTYRLDEADLLISLGADFLETWLSTVEYAWRFARFHEPRAASRNFFIYVGPRRSLTAANADHFLDVAPGNEHLVGLALLKLMLQDHSLSISEDRRSGLGRLIEPFDLQRLIAQSGVAENDLRRIAEQFAAARKPLVLAGGNPLLAPNAEAAAHIAALLSSLKKESLTLIDFDHPHALGAADRAVRMLELTDRLRHQEVDLLLIHDANPVFGLPGAWQFEEALRQVPAVVSFSSHPDETSRHAHLYLPAHTFLESWGDYEPRSGLRALLQPTMGPVFDTRPLSEIMAAILFRLQPAQTPAGMEILKAGWRKLWTETQAGGTFRSFWVQSLRLGGYWPEAPGTPAGAAPQALAELSADTLQAAPEAPGDGDYGCVVYPTIQFYDGRTANRPWLQELPDPITQVTWGGWVEVNPEDARRMGLSKGALVEVASAYGSIKVPLLPIQSVPPGRVALPIGQGHTHFGRFADGLPDNPLKLVPASEQARDGIGTSVFRVSLKPAAGTSPVANTDGSYTQQGRHLLQRETLEAYREKAAAGHRPAVTLPLPAGYLPERDFYPPHGHTDYRWAMAIDLDRCIGCGACVMACYAENNVAFVGREQMLKMREMSWIRVQRYFSEDGGRIGWLVMLCQHCDNAPCESVCPVFAPHHNPEGLNNQVYNRCFGTRFCSQNCPYKVRRFNWYTWKRAEPLNLQLNPEVTVRQKGIMEKCSFCIQRIVAAKVDARNEGREVRDGDVTTACAQTCPTEAIVFGSLLDPQSRVSRMIEDARAYQVLHHLNTKPAVFYLKRLDRRL